MYTEINEFIKDWIAEQELTLKIFWAIPTEKLNFRLNDNSRTIGRLAWHITETLTEMPHAAGIIEVDELAGKEIPENMEEIISDFTTHNSRFIEALKLEWTGSKLDSTIEMYGQTWTREKLLTVMVRHTIHHRAQITVLMRAANLTVPGIYGPALEEWNKFGMAPRD